MLSNNSSNNEENEEIIKRWRYVAKTYEPYAISGYTVILNDEMKNIIVSIHLDGLKNDVASMYMTRILLEKLLSYYNNEIKDLCDEYPELIQVLEHLNNSNIDSAKFNII